MISKDTPIGTKVWYVEYNMYPSIHEIPCNWIESVILNSKRSSSYMFETTH